MKPIDLSSIPPGSLLGRVLRSPLRLLPKDRSIRILQGPLRGARWIVGSSTHGCWIGTFEWEKQRLFADIVSPGMVVFDVGANVGFYTLLASRCAGSDGEVIAFEPVPGNVDLLRKHLEMNRCANVRVFAMAISSRPGQSAFSLGAGPSEGFVSAVGDITVDLETLDRLVHSGLAPAPDVIKIDVEGAELDVLEGARGVLSQFSPTILLATHGEAVRRDCLALLQGLGYGFKPLVGGTVEGADEFLVTRDKRLS